MRCIYASRGDSSGYFRALIACIGGFPSLRNIFALHLLPFLAHAIQVCGEVVGACRHVLRAVGEVLHQVLLGPARLDTCAA